MGWHGLSGKQFLKAIGVGALTALILSAITVTALKAGVSPMPAPVALVFAQTLLGAKLPLPVGLLFHVAWVTFWTVAYVALFRDRLSFARAAGLGIFLLALTLFVFFPYIGWGFFGLGIGTKVVVGAVMSHVLFTVVMWSLVHWTFGTHHQPTARPYSRA